MSRVRLGISLEEVDGDRVQVLTGFRQRGVRFQAPEYVQKMSAAIFDHRVRVLRIIVDRKRSPNAVGWPSDWKAKREGHHADNRVSIPAQPHGPSDDRFVRSELRRPERVAD